jgi:hypothetical protein
MIRTDAQLALARERLQQAERILELTKQECGHNPVQYPLFSAGIIDIIDSMRADIDAYLGVAPVRDPAPHPSDQEAAHEAGRP